MPADSGEQAWHLLLMATPAGNGAVSNQTLFG